MVRVGSIPQTGRHDDLGLGVLDARRQFGRGEAAEDDRVDGPEAGAGEHRDDGLRHHRHVDEDAIALLDTEVAQPAGEAGHLVEQRGIRVGLLGPGDR
jgi:hypothetical protein